MNWLENWMMYIIILMVSTVVFFGMGYTIHTPTLTLSCLLWCVSGILDHFTDRQ